MFYHNSELVAFHRIRASDLLYSDYECIFWASEAGRMVV